ncbi:MAG: fumarylacetoacetate hydrolase family protein [Alphaproteobacteria bacterium]|nr:fumarylacetoacetate hydrolase family protein [Alphaproteobacteria bacterium]MBT4086214.1 fumarylacetoacetate hydrolase family protein [Alphaproteobacteria bacterium]MBT4543831.1 fumarylacetoacetate hydrolase family protein [Alphaproteobacteria bacterium]MBT7744811.1 fumarylacetoacetate hydrolase family protein [Alphaproteobacteria bacterium]
MRAVLEADALPELQKAAEGSTGDYDLADVTLLRPVTNPRMTICVGVNYANRNAEYKDGSKEASFPSLFMRTPQSLVAHGEDIHRPPESDQLDYEGEIVLVIGKSGRRIPEDQALDHVAGVTIMNEGTLRDWIRHAKFNVTQGKNFDRSGAMGPWFVTMDEMPDMLDLRVTTRVNDEVRQDDTTASMMYPIPYLINYISTFTELHPGDIIATGTPTGAGARFDPPRYLKPGDVVEVEVEGVGILRNQIADEFPA